MRLIRQERPEDRIHVNQVVREAFSSAKSSDGNEHNLVNRLRDSDSFVPELCLVCEVDDKIVGHIMFTKLEIIDEFSSRTSLALAPVSVKPDYQGVGHGKNLIRFGLKKAKEFGYGSVVVVGDNDYYVRFGFERASKYRVYPPKDIPDKHFMILELKEGVLANIREGRVEYPKEFGIASVLEDMPEDVFSS